MVRFALRFAVLSTAVALALMSLQLPSQANNGGDNRPTVVTPQPPSEEYTPEFTVKEKKLPPIKGIDGTDIGSGSGEMSTMVDYDWKWWGLQVQFSKNENNRINYGGGYCAAVVGVVPVAGWILAMNCGVLSVRASQLRDQGRCLAINIYTPSVYSLGSWNC